MVRTTKRALAQLCSSGMVAHLTLLLIPAWFCFVLSLEGDTFSSNAVYNVMSQIMTEHNWSIFSGAVFLTSLLLWWNDSRITTVMSLGMLCFWHGMVSTSLLLTFTVTTGTGTYAILALAATLRMFGLVFDMHPLIKREDF